MMGNEIEHLFRFPKVLPNDVEDFTVYYPKKFPPIKEYYTKLVKQLHNNPVKFRQTCFDLQKDLFQGFEKIKKDYDNCKKKDLDFLIDIDQRLHKLFCYRFWIINYLFCDGPLHDYYVSKVREYAEKVSVWEDLDEKDKSVLQLERDLLQSDYADLYLKSVLKGIKLYDLMISNKTLKKYSDDIKAKVAVEKYDDSYAIIEKLLIELESHKDNKLYQEVMKLLPFHGAKVRGDNLMVYNVVIHSIQFRQKSLDLQQRFESMKVRLEKIVKLAKKKLSKKEYTEFIAVYGMSRQFIEAKDIFGEIDPQLIPFWFGKIHGEIAKILKLDEYESGHAAVFKDIVWHLPNNLKIQVMTQDLTPYDIKKL